MHRTMKSALKAKLGSDPNWVDALPLVLLGMRASVKSDLHCSVAEMVFGETLRLPGEFVMPSDGDMAADPAFVADLRQKIRLLRPIPPVRHGGESRRSYVPQELSSATHVFVRVGPRKTPLQSPYQGPFKVLERREKYFKLDLGNRHDMVSLDILKPAFPDATDAIEPVPLVTSSGRLVRLPARYRVWTVYASVKQLYWTYVALFNYLLVFFAQCVCLEGAYVGPVWLVSREGTREGRVVVVW